MVVRDKKNKLDKIIATAKGKWHRAQTYLFQFRDQRWQKVVNQLYNTSFTDSEISDNRSLIILVSPQQIACESIPAKEKRMLSQATQHNDLKYYKLNLSQT